MVYIIIAASIDHVALSRSILSKLEVSRKRLYMDYIYLDVCHM